MNDIKKILIITPSFSILGGVANHYQGLKPYWKNKVDHVFYGKRKNIPAILTLIPDLFFFVLRIISVNYDVVIINPSLRPYQVKRDGLYLLIASLLGKKVITFIHGWNNDYAIELRKSKLFRMIYGRSQFIYVLYSEFKKSLENILPNVPILLTTTKVKDDLLKSFDISNRTGKIQTLLFLARTDKQKGLDITIKTFEILKLKYPHLRLNICGTGNALEDAKKYVLEKNINDVNFKGHIVGETVAEEFKEGDIYILPSLGEGMATSILEAMAFGLPIISRPVGGINDFFKNGKMGYLLDSLSPEDYAQQIQYLIDNPIIVQKMASYNNNYAKEHFFASKVAETFETDINNYC